MNKKLRFFAMSMLLTFLLVLCTSKTACAKADGHLQVLSEVGVSSSSKAGDAERIEMLTALIVMYSEQLEEYDRSNGSFVVACIGFAGTVLGIAISLATRKNENGVEKRPDYRMSVLFALIPGITALCLYVFSMQCRRVVFFRGYLSYLEEQLGQLTGIPLVFNSHVVTKFFGEFNTMNFGFVVMGITISAMIIVSFGLCVYFAVPSDFLSKGKAFCLKKYHLIMAIFIILIVVVFCSCCVVCTADLLCNGSIPDEVYNYCMEFLY